MHYAVTLKRSVATLASAAGLLAAATGPTSAEAAPARCTVTCLDQDLNSLKSPALHWSTGAGSGDQSGALSLKVDSNEMAEHI